MEVRDFKDYIPLDKSWIIRMGILDILSGCNDITTFLDSEGNLGGDLKSLRRVVESFKDQTKPFDVGESGTIYRFVRFYTWKNGIDRPINISDTLVDRIRRGAISDNPDIVNWTPEELGKLDFGTTQWQTMAYLLGDKRRVTDSKYKLQVTYDSVDHWEKARAEGKAWQPRKDPTLHNQALAFINHLKTGKIDFVPEQAEDYCFARAFSVVDSKFLESPQGKRMFESIEGHESPRTEEMEKSLAEAQNSQIIESKDHRVVQAIQMRYFDKGFTRNNFSYPDCVNKTWPQFWDFIEAAPNL